MQIQADIVQRENCRNGQILHLRWKRLADFLLCNNAAGGKIVKSKMVRRFHARSTLQALWSGVSKVFGAMSHVSGGAT